MRRFLAILCVLLTVCVSALADTVYILCQPDSFVYVREYPRRGAQVAGYVELGDALESDGITKNGFLMVYGFEAGEAWVNLGFVSFDPVTVETIKGHIESKGRVACRRSVNGTRRKWLKNGEKVTIYGFSDSWSITNKGFIQTQFLGGF